MKNYPEGKELTITHVRLWMEKNSVNPNPANIF